MRNCVSPGGVTRSVFVAVVALCAVVSCLHVLKMRFVPFSREFRSIECENEHFNLHFEFGMDRPEPQQQQRMTNDEMQQTVNRAMTLDAFTNSTSTRPVRTSS